MTWPFSKSKDPESEESEGHSPLNESSEIPDESIETEAPRETMESQPEEQFEGEGSGESPERDGNGDHDSPTGNEDFFRRLELVLDRNKNSLPMSVERALEKQWKEFIGHLNVSRTEYADAMKALEAKFQNLNQKEREKLQTDQIEINKELTAAKEGSAQIQKQLENISAERRAIERDRKDLDIEYAKLKEKHDKYEKNQELLVKKIKKYEAEDKELKEREKKAEDLEAAATEAFQKLVPEWAKDITELKEIFASITSDGEINNPEGLLLVAQLNLLKFALTPDGNRYLNDCLKEVGRAVLAISRDNFSLQGVPTQLATMINEKLIEQELKVDVPDLDSPVDPGWMIDLAGTRGDGVVKKVVTWALRDRNRGRAIMKAEVES
jgi:hypothetical protein